MHLPSGIAPILPLAIATLLPGLSVAHVVPAINNNHGELYQDSQPAISLSYSEANLGPPEEPPVKRRDDSDPLQDIDSTSTLGSGPHKQPNTRSFDDDEFDDICVAICTFVMNDYCKEYPWVLNGKTCVDTRRTFCEQECAKFTKEVEDWVNTPFDFEWPAFIPEDEDEEGYQQMIDRTSTLSLTTDTQETTRRNDTDDQLRKELVEWCDDVCGWETKLAVTRMLGAEAEKCSMGCERVCNAFRSGNRFGDDDSDSDSDPSLSMIKQDMTDPSLILGIWDPEKVAAVKLCRIVCEFQWLFTPELSQDEVEKCDWTCQDTCDLYWPILDPPSPLWRHRPEESSSEDQDQTV